MRDLARLAREMGALRVVPPAGHALEEAAAIRLERVTADSRLVEPGGVFVAVRGTRVDGRRFLGEAARRGAAVVVLEEAPSETVRRAWQVVVGDAREALARCAAALAGHPSRKLTAVGVTGTNGKTTTALLVRSILHAAGRKAGLVGTIRYEVGRRSIPAPMTTPDPVRLQGLLAEMLEAGCDSVVMEVSSHALDQRRTERVDFDVGVFTNLASDHGDYHRTRSAYARAKRRLFEGLEPSAAAVLNAADPAAEDFAAHTPARRVWYGPGGSVRATLVETGLAGSRFVLHLPETNVEVRTGLIGAHNVENAVAAAAAGWALGLAPMAIKDGIEAVRCVPGRLERVSTGRDFEVLVDYAHTDDALGKVLEALRPLVAGRLITVFGAGGDRDRAKRPRMGRAAALLSDAVWITSDNPRSEEPAAIIEEIASGIPPRSRARVHREVDRRAAIRRAIASARTGDLVLIAGKGHERTQRFAEVEIPFDDRREALAAVECFHRPTAAAG